jgi:hypothetical protein
MQAVLGKTRSGVVVATQQQIEVVGLQAGNFEGSARGSRGKVAG